MFQCVTLVRPQFTAQFTVQQFTHVFFFADTPPPLRERKEDVPLLIQHFLEKLSRKMKKSLPVVSPEVMDILTEYAWSGNVRELEHSMERILILEDADVVRVRNLPSSITQRQGELQMFSEEPPAP